MSLGLFKGQRFAVGGHVYVPTGRPKQIGLPPKRIPKGIGEVTEIGAARVITLFVGQAKGVAAKNRAGRCASKPAAFSVAAVDRAFFKLRARVVGAHGVAGRRVSSQGWYEGAKEASVAYEVAFIPNANERTFAEFRKNMDRVAELLAAEFCQDAVLIIRDDGRKRTVADAKWTKEHERALKRKK